MQLARKDVLRSLTRKGFRREQRTKHTFFIYYDKDDKKAGISTFVSRGSGHKSLGDTLVQTMAQQCGLTQAQFVELVDCSMSRDDYDRLVAEAE